MLLFPPNHQAQTGQSSIHRNTVLFLAFLIIIVLPSPSFAQDTDGDGVGDLYDNCQNLSNPNQEDTDLDGYGNRCDCDGANDGTCNTSDAWLFGWCNTFAKNPSHYANGICVELTDMNSDGLVNDGFLFRSMFPGGPGTPQYEPGITPGPSGLPCAGVIPCASTVPGCGDHVCDETETYISCPMDCPLASCGNAACDADFESCSSCPADCGTCTFCSAGTLPGEFTVSASGAGLYSIPIEVPPGRLGMEPELSVSYSSQGGNGLLGLGWRLNGLSQITHCPATIARDGFRGGINYDANDRFCLDGVPLTAVNGVYGADGTEYRTDPDSFNRVISYGTTGSGPDYFEVEHKSGVKSYFGIAEETKMRAVGQTAVRVWALEGVLDRRSNGYTVSYEKDEPSGVIRPLSIKYTVNIGQFVGTSNEVQFIYEYRPVEDYIDFHRDGSIVKETKRLVSIRTYADGDLVNQYSFNYEAEPNTELSRLKDIRRCDAAADCLNPMVFTWQGSSPGFTPQVGIPGVTTFIGGNGPVFDPQTGEGIAQAANVDGARIKFGDFNGDGMTDMYYVQGYEEAAIEDTVYLATGTGFSGPVASNVFTLVPDDLERALFDMSRIKFGDFNGDGRTDAYYVQGWGTSSPDSIYFSNGDGTFASAVSGPPTFVTDSSLENATADVARVQFGDFNGDGKTDVYHVFHSAGTPSKIYLSNGSGFDAAINGVNTHDTALVAWQSVIGFLNYTQLYANWLYENKSLYLFSVALSNVRAAGGTDTNNILGIPSFSPQYEFPDTSHVKFGDFNGDGKTDVYWVRGGSPLTTEQDEIYFSTIGEPGAAGNFSSPVNGLLSNVNQSNFYAVDIARIVPADFNADGMTDLYYIKGASSCTKDELYISKGNGAFQKHNAPVTCVAYGHPSYAYADINALRFGDFNGDGKTDLYRITPGTPALDNIFLFLGNGKFVQAGGVNTWISLGSVDGSNGVYMQQEMFDKSTIRFGDFNGDGMTDVYKIDGFNSTTQDTVYLSQSTPTLMTDVFNGYGHETQVVYKPLTDPDVYLPDTSLAGFDSFTRYLQDGRQVAATLRTSNGLGGFYDRNYFYIGSKYHNSYGNLGMARRLITDPQMSVLDDITYEQVFPLTGREKTRTRSLYTGPIIDTFQDITMNWSSVVLAGGSQYVRLDDQTDKEWEPGGVFLRNAYTTFAYDSFGNVTQRRTAQRDAPGTTEVQVDTISNSFYNDQATWNLGLSLQTTVSRSAPSQNIVSVVIDRAWDYPKRLLDQESRPIDGGRILVQDFEYDGFGNVKKVTISGTDITTRMSSSLYDSEGRFEISNTNPLNQTTSFTFDPRFGHMLERADPNNLKTVWVYDTMGRMTDEIRPDGTTTRFEACRAGMGPFADEPPHNSHSLRMISSGEGETMTFYDVLKRELRKKSIGLNGENIYEDTVYNTKKQLSQKTRPYFSGDQAFFTNYTYDALDRLAQVQEPGGKIKNIVRDAGPSITLETDTLSNDHCCYHRETETDNLNNKIERIYDMKDQIVQIKYFDPLNTLVTYVGYEYDSAGNIQKVEDSAGNVSTMIHNSQNLITLHDDPDRGLWTFDYNVLGEQVQIDDAKSSTIIMGYDFLGRMESRNTPEGLDTWVYDSGPNAVGQLSGTSASSGASQSFMYDSLSRLEEATTTVDAVDYDVQYTYDAFSRTETVTYPGPSVFVTKNVYNANGYLSEVRNNATNALYWQADDMDASGKVTQLTLGNGLTTDYVYDEQTGLLKEIMTGAGAGIQNMEYLYNILDNLQQQEDRNQSISEIFGYDSRKRLTSVTGPDPKTYQYNGIGNMTFKSDVGTLTYGTGNGPGAGDAGPHAFETALGVTFSYDDNGNYSGDTFGGSAAFTSFNKLASLNSSGVTLDFTYDANHRKVKQVEAAGGPVKTTVYTEGLYEKVTQGSLTEHKHYINVNNVPVAIFTDRSDTTSDTWYLHRDRMNSVTKVTDETGTLLEDLSYDAYGSRRLPAWVSAGGLTSDVTESYTGHEYIDSLGLIDMNARIFYPSFGRFLSADPIIPDIYNVESLNRYSYVNNNPLNFTDPSGNGPCPPDCVEFSWEPDLDIAAQIGEIPEGPTSRMLNNGAIETTFIGAGGLKFTMTLLNWEEIQRAASTPQPLSYYYRPLPSGAISQDNTLFEIFFPGARFLSTLGGVTESGKNVIEGNFTGKDIYALATAYKIRPPKDVTITFRQEDFTMRNVSKTINNYAIGKARGEILKDIEFNINTGIEVKWPNDPRFVPFDNRPVTPIDNVGTAPVLIQQYTPLFNGYGDIQIYDPYGFR